DQSRLFELERVPVGQPQLVEGGPLLARSFDVLPLVLADGAGSGRLVALGVLRPAGRADEVRHSSPPARQSPHPRNNQFHQVPGGVTKVKGLAASRPFAFVLVVDVVTVP